MSLDEKQWLVARLDTSYKTIFDEFQLSREDFIRIREEMKSSILSKRNYILSSVVFVSALLLSLHETLWIDKNQFLFLLIPDMLVGLFGFIIASLYANANERAFILVENGIVKAQQTLNHNLGFLIQRTFELSTVPMFILREYVIYLTVVTGVAYIPFGNAMKTASKIRLLDGYYKDTFSKTPITFETVIDPAITTFSTMNQANLPVQSMADIRNMINQYQRNTPTQTRNE